MIVFRRGGERRQQRRHRQEAWLTFHPHDEADRLSQSFGPLQTLKEGRLPPRARGRLPIVDVEIITYVHEGTLLYEDSAGRSGVLRAGEFQRTTAGRGIRLSESNVSTSQWAHVFQIWLEPATTGLEPGDAQRRFSRAQRHGGLCVVASPDGRRGSLHVHQDAFLYSAILDDGHHVVHPIAEGRSAWLHVIAGNVRIGEESLVAGDGVGFMGERVVSFTATADCEVLLLDLMVDGDVEGQVGGASS